MGCVGRFAKRNAIKTSLKKSENKTEPQKMLNQRDENYL